MTNNAMDQVLLTSMAEQAGGTAHRYRQNAATLKTLKAKIETWLEVFPWVEVMAYALITLGLVCLDLFFMLPVYKSLSKLMFKDPELMAIPIGIGVNMLAIVTGEKLVKMHTSGPFFVWELHQISKDQPQMAAIQLLNKRWSRRWLFALDLLLYLGILTGLVWVRSILVANSNNPLERVELQMTIIGVCIALFSVTVGGYIFPALEYGLLKVKVLLLEMRMRRFLNRTCQLDGQILQLCKQMGISEQLTLQVKEALVRSLLRGKGMHYCDEVSQDEIVKMYAHFDDPDMPKLPD